MRFRVLIDGQPPGAAHGIDVDEQGNGTVSEQRLYQLIRQPEPIADRPFEIEFLSRVWRLFASRSAEPQDEFESTAMTQSGYRPSFYASAKQLTEPRVGSAYFNEARRHAMKTQPVSEVFDPDLRQLLSTAAMGIVAIAVAGTMLATSAFAQSARETRGPTPYFAVENEPAPKLIVDPALPSPLALGVVQIQYRVENVRIVPVFGEAALKISPRVGHLHITVDDLPWGWADASDLNTIDMAGVPPGQHKVKIELVDANHNVFPGQAATVTFTVPAQTKINHKGLAATSAACFRFAKSLARCDEGEI